MSRRVDAEAPQQLLSAGRAVFASGYAADDAFPELRALAWKRGGEVLGGGIHLHEQPTLLFVARAWGADAAFTYYHDYSGVLFFVGVLLLLYPLTRLLRFRQLRYDVI